MFSRFLMVLALAAALATALAATALATDEPIKPPNTTTNAPAAQAPQQPAACLDTMRPSAKLNAKWQRGFRNGMIRGTASDRGCAAGKAGKLKSVRVSVARRIGKRCQHLNAKGKLGRATSCAPRWLKARGTRRWSLHVRRTLPNGRYVVRVSAVDASGNVQLLGR
jgi:hypothetical protein